MTDCGTKVLDVERWLTPVSVHDDGKNLYQMRRGGSRKSGEEEEYLSHTCAGRGELPSPTDHAQRIGSTGRRPGRKR